MAAVGDSPRSEAGTDESVLDEENVFEVEKIVAMQTTDGNTLYRVRWLSYPPQYDTWEPYDNLLTCKDLVDEYISREQKKKRKPAAEKPKGGGAGKGSSDEKSKKKRQTESGGKSDHQSVTEAEPPAPDSAEKKGKDTFWKDLEEGRVDLFAEGDMYSKVKGKGRLAAKQTTPEQQQQRGKNGGGSTSKEKPASTKGQPDGKKKTRRRVLALMASDDEDDCSSSSRDTLTRFPQESGGGNTTTTTDDSNTKTDMSLDDQVQPMEVDVAEPAPAVEREPAATKRSTSLSTTPDVISPRPPAQHPSSAQQSVQPPQPEPQPPPRVMETPNAPVAAQTERPRPDKPVRRESPSEQITRTTEPADKSNAPFKKQVSVEDPMARIPFHFTPYDSEEWSKQDTHDLQDNAELTNVQFRQAVKQGDYEVLRRALNSNQPFDLEQADANGVTLLVMAAQAGFDEIVELLVVHGADINAVQRNGLTALMAAAELGHVCTTAVLVGLGAHLDVQQGTGETALMKAVRKGHAQIVQLLLENGANFATITNGTMTALKFAKQHSMIQSLLMDHISRLTAAFQTQVNITLNNTATILHMLFPVHCFSLNEANVFRVSFNHQLLPPEPGVGMLLFIAHARMTAQEIKCRLYGNCAVTSVYLNNSKQPSLTEEANFVLSFSPLRNGKNELVINTVQTRTKAKLIVCAYKAQLMPPDVARRS